MTKMKSFKRMQRDIYNKYKKIPQKNARQTITFEHLVPTLFLPAKVVHSYCELLRSMQNFRFPKWRFICLAIILKSSCFVNNENDIEIKFWLPFFILDLILNILSIVFKWLSSSCYLIHITSGFFGLVGKCMRKE